MKLAIFKAMTLNDTGERLIKPPVFDHISVNSEWDTSVPTSFIGRRYALEARFRATTIIDDSVYSSATKNTEGVAVDMARRQIAREVFGPLPDMVNTVMYRIYDGKEDMALEELRKMLALMAGEDVDPRPT